VLGRRSAPEITGDDVRSIMVFLMQLDAKLDEIRALLQEPDDGEEED
jgi:hypothetical protein